MLEFSYAQLIEVSSFHDRVAEYGTAPAQLRRPLAQSATARTGRDAALAEEVVALGALLRGGWKRVK